ncbi:RagB/SusD family nutrient uptake outer membrane protein [Niabella aquatica]
MLVKDSIFSSLNNVNGYLAQVYTNLPDEYSQTRGGRYSGPYTGASDEANWWSQVGHSAAAGGLGAGANLLNQSTWNQDFGGNFWNNWYKPVRTATDFIANIDRANPKEVPDNLKGHFKAEARALRAIFYFFMLRLYGPIPILSEQIDPNATGDALLYARTPFDSCVNYITSELDQAYNEIQSVASAQMPADQPLNLGRGVEYGRITSGACKAFKQQVLLLAASPLFNGNADYANLKNTDGTQLMPQTYDVNKWKKAADAAKAFIDEFVPSTYDMYYSTNGADPFTRAYNACNEVVLNEWNKEWIWGRAKSDIGARRYDATPKLVGTPTTVNKGGGFLAANQSMVDAYFMANGRPITDPLSGYQSSGFSNFKSVYDRIARRTFNPYINREPRFYVGVTYNNSYWLQQGGSSDIIVDFTPTGNSGRGQSTTDVSSTGYLLRKAIKADGGSIGYCYLRLAMIYLDYAEALNEYNPGNADILKYLNIIRERAGVAQYGTAELPVPATQAEMREAIWHERQVELAFENVRYFDIRRWKIAPQTMGKDVYGMNMFAGGDAFYQLTLVQRRRFLQRDYLWPIPYSELLRDKLLVQNPGW